MSWYNASWLKRQPVTLTGGASGAIADYQVKLTVTHDGDMQADFDDLRFTKADGTTLLDSWLESKVNSTSAVVWVETNTPANTVEADIYMYYGNSGAASNWDIGATFVFGDDFSGDLSKWSTIAGTPAISGGKLTIDNDWIYGNVSVATNHAFRAYGKMSATTVNQQCGFSDKTTSGASNDIQNGGHSVSMYFHSSGTMYAANYDSAQTQVATDAYDTSYHIFEIVRNSTTNTQFAEDGVTYTNTPITTNIPGQSLCAHIMDYVSTAGYSEWDWALIRKYVANPATYAFGAEEDKPSVGVRPSRVFSGPFYGPFRGVIT